MTDSHDSFEPPAYPPSGYPSSEYPPPGYVPPPVYAPPGYPMAGFQVPNYPMPGFGPLDSAAYDTDPLVAGSMEPFRGWWIRFVATFRRSGAALAKIVAIMFALPQIVVGFLEAYIGTIGPDGTRVALQLGVAVLTFGNLYLAAVGWRAAQWTLVRNAVNATAPLGEALRFGFRGGVRVWGWLLLYSLIAGLGFCALVLPGIYLAVAGGLIIPAAIFQPASSAMSTSFALVNRQFWAACGRLMLSYLPTVLVTMVAGLTSFGGISLAGASTVYDSGSDLLPSVASGIFGIPAEIALIIGVLLTYGQLRARIMPTTSADLAADL